MSDPQQMIEVLISRLVHDLKNPLAVVLSNMRFLQSSVTGVDEQDALRESVLSGERLDRMMDDAVDLGRMRGGRMSPASAAVVLSELEPALSEKLDLLTGNRTLKFDLGPERLMTDQALLLRILVNLGEHALRQTPSRGTVLVQSEPVEQGLALRVIDGGAPFSPDVSPSFLDDALSVKDAPSAGCRSDQGLGLHFAGRAACMLGAHIAVAPRSDAQGPVFELVFGGEKLG